MLYCSFRVGSSRFHDDDNWVSLGCCVWWRQETWFSKELLKTVTRCLDMLCYGTRVVDSKVAKKCVILQFPLKSTGVLEYINIALWAVTWTFSQNFLKFTLTLLVAQKFENFFVSRLVSLDLLAYYRVEQKVEQSLENLPYRTCWRQSSNFFVIFKSIKRLKMSQKAVVVSTYLICFRLVHKKNIGLLWCSINMVCYKIVLPMLHPNENLIVVSIQKVL